MIKSISIVYPIFNEEKRLAKTIRDIERFDKSNTSMKKEYILVNDGSVDSTLSFIKNKLGQNKKIKLLSYSKNRGKGYALKQGVRQAKYQWVLTTDADCSVSNFQINSWEKKNYLDNKNFIYFASRNLLNSSVKKKISRQLIGKIFQFFIKIFFKINLSDTQCGFKLYKTIYAKKIFKKILTDGYMHDVEICLIANN